MATGRVQRHIGGWTVGAMLLLSSPVAATDVRVVGITPGRSAHLVIDGNAIILEIGESTPEGIKLLSIHRDGAVVRVDGKTRTLALVPGRPGEMSSAGRGTTVVLSAGAGGHYTADAVINGRSLRCLVDTGATLTTLSTEHADRIGLHYTRGTPIESRTANGVVDGWQLALDSVRIGDVTVRDVDAVVVDNDSLPVVLLGMSFLRHFDMHRQGDTLVLRRRR